MSRALFCLAAGLLLAAPLPAAPVPAGPKADDTVPPSAAKLLEHRRVQKELKMTAEQRVALVDALGDLGDEYDRKFEALGRMPNVPEDAFEKLDREQTAAVAKVLAGVATQSLTAAQRARLQQLDRRVRGAAALTDPHVQKALQLTDAQKKKAADAAERQAGAVALYLDGVGNEDEAKRRADLFALRKELLAELEKTMTADQKAGWAALLGPAAEAVAVDELWLRVEEERDGDGGEDKAKG